MKNKIFLCMICTLMLFIPILLSAQQSQFWTGDGGSGTRLGVLEPRPTALPADQEHLPALIQSVLSSNITRYSAISVVNRQTLEEIFAESLDHIYEDNLTNIRLGQITPPDTWVTGSIIRTSSGYTLQLNVVRETRQIASHSSSITVAQLDNHIAIQRAAQDLLGQMGVQLTQAATRELDAAAAQNQIVAQVNLAQGVTAQRRGTEVTALSYYFQAAAYDPSLLEAGNRSQILSTNIISGNIGADARNDIAWRRAWVERLTETEQIVHRMLSEAEPPYSFFYSSGLKQENINYQRETVDLSFQTQINANNVWFSTVVGSIVRLTEEVYTGLVATGRAQAWDLVSWPYRGVTNNNPYNRNWNYTFQISFELVNDRNRVIGRHNYSYTRSFKIESPMLWFHERPYIVRPELQRYTGFSNRFQGVNVNEITDNLTIRVVSVNGGAPQNANFSITSLSDRQFETSIPVTNGFNIGLLIENGVVKGLARWQDPGLRYYGIDLPSEVWGERITSIAPEILNNPKIRINRIP